MPTIHSRLLLKLFAIAVILNLGACSSNSIIVDYDTTRDLSQLKQYRWASSEETLDSNQQSATSKEDKTQSIIEGNSSVPHQDLLSKRIKRSIQTTLNSKQIIYNLAQPDFIIAFQLTTQSNVLRDSFYYSPYEIYLGGCSRYSYFCTGGTFRGDAREYQYTELFLVVRFLDPKDNQVIWQGVVELPKNNSRKSAAQYDLEIYAAVNALIKRFPS